MTWWDDAACRGMNTGIWFHSPQKAVGICMSCPVQRQCLVDALRWEEGRNRWRFGVFGGMTAEQRAQLAGRRMW